MKVFGIGLEKTGTSTLGRALEILGFDSRKGFDMELLQNYISGDVERVLRAAEPHDHFEHYPWAFVYQEAYEKYPDSRFILTVRTSSFRWFNSLCHYARRTGPREERQLVYGHAMPNLFEAEDKQFYEKHNQSVRDFFAEHDSSRLLEVCWAHDHGWAELCEFLEKPVPEIEFPHLK